MTSSKKSATVGNAKACARVGEMSMHRRTRNTVSATYTVNRVTRRVSEVISGK